MSVEPWKFSAIEGLKAIRGGGLSAAEWASSLLARIRECEPLVSAWAHVDDKAVAAASGKFDRDLPLAGVPIAAKDIIDVAGMPCEGGSRLYAGRTAAGDADTIAKLRRSGAVLLGKTVTCELATNAISPTRNPWNTDHTPGGSSAGSAAAVASGMVPIALGTQTGGSILRPAAYCGVVGFKPTAGRVSCEGVMALSWSLDHFGFIARSAADAALAFDAVVGGQGEFEPVRPARIGYLKADFLARAADEVAERVEASVARLRDAGVEVVEMRLPRDMDSVHAVTRTIIRAESAAVYEDAFRENPDAFGPDIRNNVVTGLMIPAAHYLRALRLRSEFSLRLEDLFAECDLLLTPSTMDTAPRWDVSTGDPLFSEPFSLSGHPAITLPAGFGAKNLPIGVQLVGAWKRDDRLLRMAAWCGAELGWSAAIAAQGVVK